MSQVRSTCKKLLIGAVAALLTIGVCVSPAFAAGDWGAYSISDDAGQAYYVTHATSEADFNPANDKLVYCLDFHASYPEDSGTWTYTGVDNADNATINAAATSSSADVANKIRAVLAYGYPNDTSAWETECINEGITWNSDPAHLRVYTQAAIWHYTNGQTFGHYDPTTALINLAEAHASSMETTTSVSVYTSDSGASQNLIAGSPVAQIGTMVSIQVNKTWTLSSGDSYTGTKPTVVFKLYSGTDTSGTPVAAKQLSPGQTSVTFNQVSIDTETTYTLTEEINGSVTNYTFTPAANQTIDLSGATAGSTHTVTVNNTVTENNTPDTTSINVEKKWADGVTGDSAVIVLTRNGDKTDQKITLTGTTDNWKGSFDNLPKYDSNGTEIEYGVVEETNTYKYRVESDGEGGFIVTNYDTIENNNSDNPDSDEESSSDSLPDTGDTALTFVGIQVLVATLAGAYLLRKRLHE
ncbi:MAG: Cna B-type domain-containing protein [Eggerthellaceae bacterium]|jgi:TQXA domain-containing protein/LPXTG-motif cell wall-anchored protein